MIASLAGLVLALAVPMLGVLAEVGGEGGDAFWLLLAGPAAGGGVYWTLYRTYRNTDKTHRFERDTHIDSQPVTGHDKKVKERRGTRSAGIDGENSRAHRQRVRRL